MNNERFEQLKASIIEAGIILQGKQKPSREFQFKVVNKPNNLEEIWAICLESDDAKLLIPRKLYLVKFLRRCAALDFIIFSAISKI